MVDKQLLNILACPACKGDITEELNTIVCKQCNKIYPVEEGIPVMLLEDDKKSD